MIVRAAVASEEGAPLIMEDLELENPRVGEVLVRVAATGICQTDLHICASDFPATFPLVAGHEGAGVVERVGEGVRTVSVGDRVVMSYPFCGRCRNCQRAEYPYCESGVDLCFGGHRLDGTTALHRRDGTSVSGHIFQQSSWATHALSTEANVVPVGDAGPLELVGPLACGLQTGAGTVLHSLGVRPGEGIAIFGTGAVGLAAVMAAAVVGARPIIAVDVLHERLDLACELGATHAIDARTDDVAARLAEIAPRGFDHVVEATGRPEMLSVGVEALTMTGTVALVAGVAPGTSAEIDMTTLLNGRTVRGVIQGDAIAKLFIPEMLALHADGRFPFERLISFYDFDEINHAIEDMQAGRTIKPVLRIGDER